MRVEVEAKKRDVALAVSFPVALSPWTFQVVEGRHGE